MIRSELVQIVAMRNPHLYRSDVERIVAIVFEDIAETLEQGGRVELRGFGIFSVRHRPSRSGRNPKNGRAVLVEDKWVPFFKTGKEMQNRLNAGGNAPGVELQQVPPAARKTVVLTRSL